MTTGTIFAALWLVTLSGGLIVLGALGALTTDSSISPLFGPYRLAWTAWSLEVYALLLALYALAVGPFRHWRASVVATYATINSALIYLTNEVLVNKGALPGSNGSDTRANVTAAGLIVVLTGNFLQIALAALHDSGDRTSVGVQDASGKAEV